MDLHENPGGKILVFDGATGTMLQSRGLPSGMAPEAWCLEKPEESKPGPKTVRGRGAQVVETNTLGGYGDAPVPHACRTKYGGKLSAVRCP